MNMRVFLQNCKSLDNAKIAEREKNMHRAESGANGPTGAGAGGSSPMGYGPVRWGGGRRGEEARELGLGRLRSMEAEQRLKWSWRSSVSGERKQGQRLAMQVV